MAANYNSLLNAQSREEIIGRIRSLNANQQALWGKMKVFEMVSHCIKCDDMFQSPTNMKQVFIGRLIGKFVLNKILKDDSQFGKNSPTAPVLKTEGESGDLEQEKEVWMGRIRKYEGFANNTFSHPFFGKMTIEQIGRMTYKHADHHLRQFGA